MIRNANQYLCKLFKRKENSRDYEDKFITFRARLVNDLEKSSYQPINGLITKKKQTYLEVQDNIEFNTNDKVEFLSKKYLITSTGVFLTQNRRINAYEINDDYILKNAPKGISLE